MKKTISLLFAIFLIFPALVYGEPLPDGEVVNIDANGGKIWLSHPTKRYGHGVLGDAIEAGGITYSKSRKPLVLSENSVFEDRLLRPVDLNGDDLPEFIVVKSYLDQGAAIAAISIKDGTPKIIAETAPIGLSNRWLNPVGAADFDGDGEMEVAAVITPHIGGILKLYGFRKGKFVLKYQEQGFSNHAYGSRQLRLSTIGDIDGDGLPELFIPDTSRTSIRVVGFKGQKFSVIRSIKVSGSLEGPLIFSSRSEPQLTYYLKNGKTTTITFTP